jgi:hypothetical protein
MRAPRRELAIEHQGLATYLPSEESKDESVLCCFFSSRSVDERKELV